MKTIPFSQPYVSEQDARYVMKAIESRHLSGDGPFTSLVESFLETRCGVSRALFTSSCTDALELAALTLHIQPGEEIILPSFTFVSTATAFALRGARLIFADSERNSPNIDPEQIRRLITERTRAIVVIHYAGICCDLEQISKLAVEANAVLIEDAAQALDSTYVGRPAGTFGSLSTLSFHQTKNLTCGEGGMLMINDTRYIEKAEVVRQKGTDRSSFLRGERNRYQWVDLGSSFSGSDLNAALLYSQLLNADMIQARRREIFDQYDKKLGKRLSCMGIGVPEVPADCVGNGHSYYLVLPDSNARNELAAWLRTRGIESAAHYSSLHRSPYFSPMHDGRALQNSDRFTDCLLRLPLFFELSDVDVEYVCDQVLHRLGV